MTLRVYEREYESLQKQKRKKSMKKEFDELTDYRSRLEKNRNKIENNYEGINSLDESTERKKRELQLTINRIIIQMNECIIYKEAIILK